MAMRRRGHKPPRQTRPVLLGKAPFTIAAGKRAVIPVRLNRTGRKLLGRARRHRVKVRLSGRGVKHRTVLLRADAPSARRT
jgi:hypothetical protein